MLRRLYIENVAVIEKADISFDNGFTVLSGETGAGKSIIIDSINAILGYRVSRELIRTGAREAMVTALFDNVSSVCLDKAAELGIEISSDGCLTISRQIMPDGRNICRVNGRPAVLSTLRDLSPMLVNIHGQHDGQNLLDERLHIDYLDNYAGLNSYLEKYSKEYDELLRLNRYIRGLSLSHAERNKRSELLSEQLKRLEEVNVRKGEYKELLSLRDKMYRTRQVEEALMRAASNITGNDEQPGALGLVSQTVKDLATVPQIEEEISNFLTLLRGVEDELYDVSSEIARYIYRSDYSPQVLDETEKRLEDIASLAEVHKVDPDHLPDLLMDIRSELDVLQGSTDDLEELQERYSSLRSQVFESARALTSKRSEAAKKFSEEVCEELEQLDMPSARMVTEVETQDTLKRVRFTKKGIDTVRFLLTTNKGESLKPLSKVASGGELSRIMLALKKVLSASEPSCTSIFDEIDTGVSGRAANKVGQKLYEISRGRQVICVTHLPQIACLADHHFSIEKREVGEATYTLVEPLDSNGRVEEISRMTSGINVTESSIKSAEEMLEMANKYKLTLSA